MLFLENDIDQCTHIPVLINNTLIQEITKAYYIILLSEVTKISTKCSTEKTQFLHGNILLEVPHGSEFHTSKYGVHQLLHNYTKPTNDPIQN